MAQRNGFNVTQTIRLFCGLLLGLWVGLSSGVFADAMSDASKAVRLRQYEKAVTLYRQEANRGNADAQFQIAKLYSVGRGTPVDISKAKFWYEKAAKQHHAEAQFSLAMLIEKTEPSRALRLLKSSANQQYPPAIDRLSTMGTVQPVTSDNLFTAAKRSDVAQLNRLKKAGADLFALNETGASALAVAVESNAIEAVKWLLDQGLSPKSKDKYGLSPLSLAITAQNTSLFKTLLDRSKTPLPLLKNGDHLLHHAVKSDNRQAVDGLLSYGVDINALNGDQWTPLDIALDRNNAGIIASLKKAKAKPGEHWKNASNEATSHIAADVLKQPVAQQNQAIEDSIVAGNSALLDAITMAMGPRRLSQMNSYGESFLTLAAKSDSLESAILLQRRGVNLNQPNRQGETAIQIAAQRNHSALTLWLMNQGADPLLTNTRQMNALELALDHGHGDLGLEIIDSLDKQSRAFDAKKVVLIASKRNLPEVVKQVISNHHNLNAYDDNGRNALWYAALHRQVSLMSPLIKAGVDPVKNKQGVSVLVAAARSGCLPCVKILSNHASLDETEQSVTAMMVAANANDIDIVAWLIGEGADAELRNTSGNSALIYAIESDAVDVVKVLMDAGVSVRRKNLSGLSALDIAEQSHPELYELLR